MEPTTRRRRNSGPSCCQLRFVAQEAGSLCQCLSDALGYGGNDATDEGRDDVDCVDAIDEVRHLVLVDKAAFASNLGARAKRGVRVVFVSSVWDVSRAVGTLRGLRSVSLVVGAEASKRSVLRCDKKEGKLVYAALVEVARLARLRAVYVLGIDKGSIAAYLDLKTADDGLDDEDVTVFASGEDWKVTWSSNKAAEVTLAQEGHADTVFATRPVERG
jgi:hypothetical protein